ncbi:unnamed protein product [Peniophora sp. CBMAI 1063]|nr:unnamed protein product [Peniophora sp. CBMAI 1063]
MADPNQNLPPGWIAEWSADNGRYFFVETASGHTQWEHPAAGGPPAPVASPPLAAGGSPPPVAGHHHKKRRQYAAGETQAYYGAGPDLNAPAGFGAPGQPQMAGQGQFFTPGEAQQQGYPQQPQDGGYYGQQPQQPQQPEYINAPGYGQQPPAYGQQPGMDQLAGQFGQMGIQKPHLQTTNLLTTPPDPRELLAGPPEIILPPGATISPSPHVNAHPDYQRCTVNAFPSSSSLAGKAKVPLSVTITPYRSIKENEEPVPLVTDMVIARCRRCRMYMNPFVTFIDNGSRYRCPMCGLVNEVPQMFDWDQQNNTSLDRWQRAELNYGVVEYVAPAEYVVRPPQPLVYVFLIDVSHTAVQSGMVATAARTLLENLDRLPNDDSRTRVAIIGFDSALYFFSMPPTAEQAHMLVVSDVDDVFLPQPHDLSVNINESRAVLESLLGQFNDMFKDNHDLGSALGPALQAGFKLISNTGGKLITLSASLPNSGAGALKNREDPKVFGTPKESALLQAASPFYKTFAIECSKAQVSVDMFLFSPGYQDVASLSALPHYTSGQTFFYPAFNAARAEDAVKFAHEFGAVLAQPILVETIIRVRASRGVRMSSFHGNFFLRSTDLLAMPTVPNDVSYTIELEVEETLSQPYIIIQTGVLHTTCNGERRVRVVTTALPTTSNLSDIYASVDQVAVATYFANKAVERSVMYKLEDARDLLQNKLVELLQAYKGTMTAAGAGASAQLAVSENMKMLPLLILGLLKNVGIRQSAQIPSDLRAYAQCLLTSLPAEMLIPYIHPMFYALHSMSPEAGTIGEHGTTIMPTPLPLTTERLERHGLYLIEDGQTLFLFVGRDAVPQLIQDVFDLPNYEALRGGKTTLPLLDNDFSRRVNAVLAKTREMRHGPYYAHLYVVKEDGEPPLRLWALSLLIQDRADVLPSYQQFVGMLKDKVNGSGY